MLILKLARMDAMGELKAVYMPSEAHREFRSLVKYRKTLDGRICKMKCTIRAWFVNDGITIDTGEKAWHSGRTLINSFRKLITDCEPNELWKGELDIELTQLDAVTSQMELIVSAYFRLVPRQYQSGETDRNGRITKRGNPLARTILVGCA